MNASKWLDSAPSARTDERSPRNYVDAGALWVCLLIIIRSSKGVKYLIRRRIPRHCRRQNCLSSCLEPQKRYRILQKVHMFRSMWSLKHRDSENAPQKGKHEGTGIVAPFRAFRFSPFAVPLRDHGPRSWILAIPALCPKIRAPYWSRHVRLTRDSAGSSLTRAYSKSESTYSTNLMLGMISLARAVGGRNGFATQQQAAPPIVGRHPKTRLVPEHSVHGYCRRRGDPGGASSKDSVCTRSGRVFLEVSEAPYVVFRARISSSTCQMPCAPVFFAAV